MKKTFRFAAIAVILVSQVSSFSAIPDKQYIITDFGARGDSSTLNTATIQACIDKCTSEGGGTVLIPKGIFISGAIFLKKNVSLRVEKDGKLKGSVNQADYPRVMTRWEGEEREWISALVNAIDLEGVRISGEGTIDGSGDTWTQLGIRMRQQQPAAPAPGTVQRFGGRPRLIAIQNCRHIKVSGLKLHNEASWGLFVLYSNDVEIADLHITADHNIPSSDGIDIDSSVKVHIIGTYIDVNDDCISIKSCKDEDGLRVNRPAEDILVEKCHFAYGHGGVAMGSETSGGIRNVEVRNCLVDAGNWAPIRFKSQPSRGGG